MPLTSLASRHHPALVALHWLLALMLMVALMMGTFVLSAQPLDAPGKVDALRGHMVVGMLIGALMLVRLVVRKLTVKHVVPTPSSGSAAKDALAKFVHVGLYVLVFAMAASGMATALLTGLPSAVNLFRLLEARPALLDLLARILSLAPPLADALARRAYLLDPLIDASAFELPPSVE